MTRSEAEEFLAREVLLIDDRRFEEWSELFTDDGLYWVPGDDPDLDPNRQVSIIYDDQARRAARVARLQHRSNWRDDPPGRLMHAVSNVLVDELADSDDVVVSSNQLICHSRHGENLVLAARCTHHLRMVDGTWRISLKKVRLSAADQYLGPGAIVLL